MDFVSWKVTLAAKALYRFRMDPKTAGSFQDTEIVIQ
jgi:hypothetical protein